MILTVCNLKGGTGKTTTAAVLAQAAVFRGKKVLAVDMDAQASLTYALGGSTARGNSFNLLHGMAVEKMTQKTKQGVDLIAANYNLSAEASEPGSGRRLRKALASVEKDYDLIIIDTPTMTGEAQINAMMAADRYLIPVRADVYGLQAIDQILPLIEAFRQVDKKLQPAGVLLTEYNGRTNLADHMRELIREKAKENGLPYLGEIRPAVAVGEAALFQESLFTRSPKSKPAQDYLALFDKLMKAQRRKHNGKQRRNEGR